MSKISREKKRKKKAEMIRLGLLPTSYCEGCGGEFIEEKLIHGPDPYSSEIKNDNTPVTLCENCHHESCWSI